MKETDSQSKNTTGLKKTHSKTQIFFRTTQDRKHRLDILLAERGQTLQWFMNRLLERALPVQKEQN